MNYRKMYGLILGLISLVMIANLIYRLFSGLSIGYQHVILTSIVTFGFLYTWTWGPRKSSDRISPNEELGKTIERKSLAYSYYPLVGILWIGLIVDKIVTDTTNITLLVILGIALIVPAVLSFIIAQTYAVEPNAIGRAADGFVHKINSISKTKKTSLLIITGYFTTQFITGPVFRDSGNLFYDILVFLFGEPSENGSNFLPLLFSAVTIFLIVYSVYRFKKSIDEED